MDITEQGRKLLGKFRNVTKTKDGKNKWIDKTKNEDILRRLKKIFLRI